MIREQIRKASSCQLTHLIGQLVKAAEKQKEEEKGKEEGYNITYVNQK